MNKLPGRISAIESNGHLSLVDVDVDGHPFTATLLETPDSAPYLRVGAAVMLLFKETEVSLAKNLSGLISLRNRFPATVMRINDGQIMSEVALTFGSHPLSSIVTSRAVARLRLKPSDQVEALVKANEISLVGAGDDV
jgi:molybdate transport system regulatory protein